MNQESPPPPPEIPEQIAKAIIKYAGPLIGLSAAGTGIYYLTASKFLEAEIAGTIVIAAALFGSFGEGLMKVLKEWMNERGEQSGRGITRGMDKLLSTLGWIVSGFRGQYLKSIRDTCRDLKIEGFKIGLPVLDLEDVFVPLKVVTGIPGQMSGAMVQSIGDGEAQEIWSFLSQSNKIETYHRIAILAPPGYGKTTLLQHLTLTYAKKAHRKRKVPDLIPVLIYLRNVREQLIKKEPPTLVALIEAQLSEGLNSPPNWFETQLKAGHCLVMLDGLDEVANTNERQQVSQWVNQQIKRYRQTQTTFLLTSRPHGYQSNILEDVGLVLEVKPFTLEQVKQFIHSWYLQTEIRSRMGRDDPAVRRLARENASNLIEAIIRKPAIRQMASNPLLVTMIATVHYCGDALPGRRVELYQKICDVLLGARQVAKKIETPLTKEQSKSVLQELALKLMEQGKRGFTLSEGEAMIQASLKKVQRKLTPQEFIQQIKEISGLLVEKQVGTYEFAHLSLQEYLAAAQIEKLQQEAILTTNFLNPWWAETIRLYAAQADATNLIRVALQDQNLYSLSLAYDCLEESLQVDPTVDEALENLLEAGLESDDPALAQMAAEVKLSRRLNNLLDIDDSTAIDLGYITGAEYRLAVPDAALSRLKDPIANIGFLDAVKFCHWLSANATKLQRLQNSDKEQPYHYRQLTPQEEKRYPVKDAVNQRQCLRIARMQLPKPIAALWNQIESNNRYYSLFHCLMDGQWQEADKETARIMLEVAGQTDRCYLDEEDIANFPCEDLRILDQLWVQFSGGRFGFSVQKEIYVSVGGKLDKVDRAFFKDDRAFYNFCHRVGWRIVKRGVVNYGRDVRGNLPSSCVDWMPYVGMRLVSSLAQRTANCNI